MTCPCCKQREGNRSNTHFLTDAIIRSCLNVDGSSVREKGIYANMSEISRIEIGFQRNTPVDKILEEFKRLPTEEEIEKAKKNPYSVDNVFCSQCEDLFHEIEDPFTSRILPKLRMSDPKPKALIFSEVKTMRLFFYLQLWRTSVCLPEFPLPEYIKEEFRKAILDHGRVSGDDLTKWPLSITFLETIGGATEFTKNWIGTYRFANPIVILMNDFFVQLHLDQTLIRFLPFFCLNGIDFRDYVNLKESEFKIRIIDNDGRLRFNHLFTLDQVRQRTEYYRNWFVKLWLINYGSPPPIQYVFEFIHILTRNSDESILNYTTEEVMKITMQFISEKLKQ